MGALKLNKAFVWICCLVLCHDYFVFLFCMVWAYRFEQSRIMIYFHYFKDNSIIRDTYSYKCVGCAVWSMLRSITSL